MDLGLMKAHSGLKHQGSNWKGTSGIQGETEVSGIKVSAGGQLPLGQNSRGQAATIVPFLSSPLHRAAEWLHHI